MEPGGLVLVPASEIRPGKQGPTLPYPRSVVAEAPRFEPSRDEIVGPDARVLDEYYRSHFSERPAPPEGNERKL